MCADGACRGGGGANRKVMAAFFFFFFPCKEATNYFMKKILAYKGHHKNQQPPVQKVSIQYVLCLWLTLAALRAVKRMGGWYFIGKAEVTVQNTFFFIK